MKYLTSFFLLLIATSAIEAQVFNFHSLSPFGIQTERPDSTKAAFFYEFIDYDQDDDLDLILSGIDSLGDIFNLSYKEVFYFVDYQENIGDKTHPAFADRVSLVDDFPFYPGFVVPAAGDLDHDGRVDLLISAEIVDSSYVQHLLYYHQRPDGDFDVSRMTNMGIEPILPRSSFTPELTDLDRDGDLDILLTGTYTGLEDLETTESMFLYAKNIGDDNSPNFLGWFENPYGLVAGSLPPFSASGDMDKDGDMDILSIGFGDSISLISYYENIPGTNGKPAFQAPVLSPFGLPPTEIGQAFALPILVDLDGDGDLDLFMLRNSDDDLGGLNYFENTLSSGIKPLEQDVTQLITVMPNPTRESLTILNSSSRQIEEVSIYNTGGILVKAIRNKAEKTFDVRDMQPGMYLLRIALDNGDDVVKKVIISSE